MKQLSESVVEDVALDGLGTLGWTVTEGANLAPGTLEAEGGTPARWRWRGWTRAFRLRRSTRLSAGSLALRPRISCSASALFIACSAVA